jgi:hypothetical protein
MACYDDADGNDCGLSMRKKCRLQGKVVPRKKVIKS